MPTPCLVRLAPSVAVTRAGAEFRIGADRVHFALSRDPVVEQTLQALTTDGVPLAGRASTPPAAFDRTALVVTALLRRFGRLGWLQYSIPGPGPTGPLLTATPTAPPRTLDEPDVDPDRRYVLSRFTYCHARHGVLVLRSPRSFFEVTAADDAIGRIVACLAAPQRTEDLAVRTGVTADVAAEVVGLLLRVNQVCGVDDEGRPDEDGDADLRQWEFHDLLFHATARDGVRGGASGGTYRFAGELDPQPAVPEPGPGATVTLPGPLVPRRIGVTFDDVLEGRASLREHGSDPITIAQLGEFLHRAARIVEIRDVGDEQVCRRPFASGGALHELELYLLVDRCADLPAGLYHYCARDHELERLSDPTEHTAALLQDARYSTATDSPPQILVLVATRLPRLAWKYEAIAYSLTLKHVGCLVQTMYLVATSMGLAPCGVGGGNSELFARATGLSPYAQTSVGEFTLGTRPEELQP